MSSGVQCTDECVTKFNELKLKVRPPPAPCERTAFQRSLRIALSTLAASLSTRSTTRTLRSVWNKSAREKPPTPSSSPNCPTTIADIACMTSSTPPPPDPITVLVVIVIVCLTHSRTPSPSSLPLRYTTADGNPRNKIVFIYWSPDTAKVKSKMVCIPLISPPLCPLTVDGPTFRDTPFLLTSSAGLRRIQG